MVLTTKCVLESLGGPTFLPLNKRQQAADEGWAENGHILGASAYLLALPGMS